MAPQEAFPLTEWLRLVLRTARKEAGLTLRAIDKAADIHESQASRFETGKSGVIDLDAHVAGYARATGRAPSSLWQEALNYCAGDPDGVELQAAKAVGRIVRESDDEDT